LHTATVAQNEGMFVCKNMFECETSALLSWCSQTLYFDFNFLRPKGINFTTVSVTVSSIRSSLPSDRRPCVTAAAMAVLLYSRAFSHSATATLRTSTAPSTLPLGRTGWGRKLKTAGEPFAQEGQACRGVQHHSPQPGRLTRGGIAATTL
jgi:hypothetical protein